MTRSPCSPSCNRLLLVEIGDVQCNVGNAGSDLFQGAFIKSWSQALWCNLVGRSMNRWRWINCYYTLWFLHQWALAKPTCCLSRKSSASGKFDVRVEKAVTCGGTKRGTDVAPKPQPTPLQQPLHVSQLLQPCDVLIKLSNVQAAIKRRRSERLFGTHTVQVERLLSEEKGNWWWKLLKSYFNVSQSVYYSFFRHSLPVSLALCVFLSLIGLWGESGFHGNGTLCLRHDVSLHHKLLMALICMCASVCVCVQCASPLQLHFQKRHKTNAYHTDVCEIGLNLTIWCTAYLSLDVTGVFYSLCFYFVNSRGSFLWIWSTSSGCGLSCC